MNSSTSSTNAAPKRWAVKQSGAFPNSDRGWLVRCTDAQGRTVSVYDNHFSLTKLQAEVICTALNTLDELQEAPVSVPAPQAYHRLPDGSLIPSLDYLIKRPDPMPDAETAQRLFQPDQ